MDADEVARFCVTMTLKDRECPVRKLKKDLKVARIHMLSSSLVGFCVFGLPQKSINLYDMLGDGVEYIMVLKYVRLPKFYFRCGVLGHMTRECSNGSANPDIRDTGELAFGYWLKALAPMKRVNYWESRVTSGVGSRFACGGGTSGRAPQSRLTGFYGHPEVSQCHHGWTLIHLLHEMSNLLWLCTDDFNEIICDSEKAGGTQWPRFQMEAFRETLDDCDLEDLGYSGPDFAWCNKRGGGEMVQERLDKGLCNCQ
ncbi:hypothetical protein Ddye_023518 [Dipteronia dyeriana]|uniref:CCHC-type domain-containing protein n=1 Tax=Dipteronia dyeriana TaxID=168575 RepID=A0AAD9TU22_9ROSI|nr:hypothetical protein Ddye_023518 [Dipteronia dyeriana]